MPSIKPDEQSAVGPPQKRSAWRALLENIELMPQGQNFGRMKRKTIAIINRNHVLIRLSPSPRRMEFSEATGKMSSGNR
jgi:hypothetical protein